MKLLWLCNMAPGIVSGKKNSGLWIDHVLEDLCQRENLTIRVLFPGDPQRKGTVDEHCSFGAFCFTNPYDYLPEVEAFFRQELEAFAPDVIHIWGTEYAHTLAMVNAAEQKEMLDRAAVSIQGLCSEISHRYVKGIPPYIQNRSTFRDLLRRDNILQQQKKFVLRGELEVQALKKVRHVIGRTHWDRACTRAINPGAQYHFCNETLREPFYEGAWSYADCQKHRIFASSCAYPVKGFHYLLEACAQVLKAYPDATLAVPGPSVFPKTLRQRLRQSSYPKYLAQLAKRYGLEEKIEFLGSLDAEQMKEQYQRANVFALPSTIENSPNSLGEAMLLGVPCVAADVGGVTNMMTHEKEGFVYQPSAEYMLADYIERVFAMEQEAEILSNAARAHARITHDPQTNLETLLSIYESLK